MIAGLLVVVAVLAWKALASDDGPSETPPLSRVPESGAVEFCAAGANVYAAIVFSGAFDQPLADEGFAELDRLHADRYGLDTKVMRLDAQRGNLAPRPLLDKFEILAGCSAAEWNAFAERQRPVSTTAPATEASAPSEG